VFATPSLASLSMSALMSLSLSMMMTLTSPTFAAVAECPLEGTTLPPFESVAPIDPSGPALDRTSLGNGTLVAFVDVDARPEQVWSVLTDFDARPKVFREVQSVAVQRIDAGVVSVRQSNLRFGWSIRYTTVSTLRPELGRIEVRLDPSYPHDIADLSGVWEIRPTTDSAKTRVSLYLRLDSGLPIPHFVERRMLRHSVEHSVAAVAAEARTRCIGRQLFAVSANQAAETGAQRRR
jgi:hypothetical protein